VVAKLRQGRFELLEMRSFVDTAMNGVGDEVLSLSFRLHMLVWRLS
jgi:hypothetical protein